MKLRHDVQSFSRRHTCTAARRMTSLPCVPRRSRSRAASNAALRSCASALRVTVTACRAVCISSSSCAGSRTVRSLQLCFQRSASEPSSQSCMARRNELGSRRTSLLELLVNCCMARLHCTSFGGRSSGPDIDTRCGFAGCDRDPGLLSARRDKPTALLFRLIVELLGADRDVTLSLGAAQLLLTSTLATAGTKAGPSGCAVIEPLAVIKATSPPGCALFSRSGDARLFAGDGPFMLLLRCTRNVGLASRCELAEDSKPVEAHISRDKISGQTGAQSACSTRRRCMDGSSLAVVRADALYSRSKCEGYNKLKCAADCIAEKHSRAAQSVEVKSGLSERYA